MVELGRKPVFRFDQNHRLYPLLFDQIWPKWPQSLVNLKFGEIREMRPVYREFEKIHFFDDFRQNLDNEAMTLIWQDFTKYD